VAVAAREALDRKQGAADTPLTADLRPSEPPTLPLDLPAGLTWVHLVDPETQVNAT